MSLYKKHQQWLNIKKLKNLLKEGADINAQDEHGNTALHIAALDNQTRLVKFLTEIGIDLSIKNKEGMTALQLDNSLQHSEVVYVLEYQLDYLRDLLFIAIESVNIKKVKDLQKRGVDVNFQDNDGNTVLHCAIKNAYDTLLSQYMSHEHNQKFNPDDINKKPFPFDDFDENYSEIVKILAKQSNLDLQNSTGVTALELTKELLKKEEEKSTTIKDVYNKIINIIETESNNRNIDGNINSLNLLDQDNKASNSRKNLHSNSHFDSNRYRFVKIIVSIIYLIKT